MRGFGLDEMKTKTPVWRARRALECSIPYRIDFHILHPLHLLFHWASVVFGANKQQLYDAFLLSHIPKIHVMKMQKLFDRRKSIQHSGNGSNMINYGQVGKNLMHWRTKFRFMIMASKWSEMFHCFFVCSHSLSSITLLQLRGISCVETTNNEYKIWCVFSAWTLNTSAHTNKCRHTQSWSIRWTVSLFPFQFALLVSTSMWFIW